MEEVILVDQFDNKIGTMEKMQAHKEGLLHRAFSIFIFNSKNELLLHKRAAHKYHSAGLWTNTCCSHPRPGESVADAAKRRIKEEMGFECEVKPLYDFIYYQPLENGLAEHELDHVLIGTYNDEPNVNADEVAEWKYENLNNLDKDIKANPDAYTAWFKLIYPKIKTFIKNV